MASPQQEVASFLVKHMTHRDAVTRLSNELRELGIADLRDVYVAKKMLEPEGTALLVSLITFSEMGVLNKLVFIKQKIKE